MYRETLAGTVLYEHAAGNSGLVSDDGMEVEVRMAGIVLLVGRTAGVPTPYSCLVGTYCEAGISIGHRVLLNVDAM
jgi:hypothetical protein